MPDKRPIDIPPRGSRGTKMPFGGALMRFFQPLINMLTTVGAHTGKERTHVLGGFPDGDDAWLIVASNGGAPTHPNWFINLAKNPDKVWVEVGNRKFRALPDSLKGAERQGALARVAAVAPRYGEYQRKTDREIPVIRLTCARRAFHIYRGRAELQMW